MYHSRGHFQLVPGASFTVGNKKMTEWSGLKDSNWPIHHSPNENKRFKLALKEFFNYPKKSKCLYQALTAFGPR